MFSWSSHSAWFYLRSFGACFKCFMDLSRSCNILFIYLFYFGKHRVCGKTSSLRYSSFRALSRTDISSLVPRMLHLRGSRRWHLTGLVFSHRRFWIHSFVLLHNMYLVSGTRMLVSGKYMLDRIMYYTNAVCMCDFVYVHSSAKMT